MLLLCLFKMEWSVLVVSIDKLSILVTVIFSYIVFGENFCKKIIYRALFYGDWNFDYGFRSIGFACIWYDIFSIIMRKLYKFY